MRDLRNEAADLCGTQRGCSTWPKLYVFQDVPGAPRGTSERVKLDRDEDFLTVRSMPDGGRTVYFFSQDRADGVDGSPPDAHRPKAFAQSTGNRSDSSARAEFANAVRRRYRLDGLEPIRCLLCGETEGMKSFDSCHLVPFDADDEDFLQCGLGNKTDVRNGVPMCSDCHYSFDRGYWGFDHATMGDDGKIRLRVHVTEGLQQYGDAWAQRHGQIREVPTGIRWPTVEVWKHSWDHNYRRQQQARRAEVTKRCPDCNRKYTAERGYMNHKCNPRTSTVIMPSPRRHWPPRAQSQSQRLPGGAAAAGPPLLAPLSPRTPPARPSEPPPSATPGGGGRSRGRGCGRGRGARPKKKRGR